MRSPLAVHSTITLNETMKKFIQIQAIAHPGHEIYLCKPDPANPSCMTTWNRAEFLAATNMQSG